MPDNLEGVFVEGKPLVEFLKDAERDDKSRQIEDVRKQSEKLQSPTIVYAVEKRVKPDTRKVKKRVRRFTDREIREEYGIMEKPFESHAENTIWTIIEKGPIGTRDIGKEINFQGGNSSLSAIVSTIWKRLGDKTHDGAANIFERTSQAGKFLYSKRRGIDISVERAIEKYRLVGQAQYRKKRLSETLDQKEEDLASRIDPPLTSDSNSIVDDIAEIVQKQFGIQIKVSGRIDIVFRFER